MTLQQKFEYLMGGIGGLLMVASAIGWILHRRAATDQGRDLVSNLNARIRAWWVMIAVFAIAHLLGPLATIVLFGIASFFALREFITLTPTRRADYRPLLLCFYVLIPVQYFLIADNWYGLYAIFIPVYGFVLLPSLSALADDPEHFLDRTAKIQWAVMITIYCISHVPALMMLNLKHYAGQNALLVFYLLMVVQLNDVLQYVFGKLFGRRKLAPRVSPSKTVEGFVGGTLGATAIGAGMWWITPFSPLQALAISFVVVLAGSLGGLALSAVKRSLGAKDWGTMIEGHGGMLDRMDSVSFSAPIFFHLVRYFFSA